MAVHTTNMRATDADDGVLDGSSGDVFGGFGRFLYRGDGLVEFDDNSLREPRDSATPCPR